MAHSHLFHPVVLACLGAYALTSTSVLAQQRPDSGTTQQQADRPKLVLPELGAPNVTTTVVKRAFVGGDIKVVPSGFRFIGNTLVPDAELQATVAGLIGKEIDFNGLADAAASLRQVYASKGYVLTDVYFPEQQFNAAGGIVEFTVIEARMGTVTVNVAAGSGVSQAFATALAQTYLVPGVPLSQYMLDKPVLLLRDMAGTDAEATVVPGTNPGEANVEILVTPRGARFEPYVSVDNMGARSSGEYRFAAGVTINAPFGMGDRFVARVQAADQSGNPLYRLSYGLALGSFGTKVTASYTENEYVLGKQFATLLASGSAKVTALSAVHPLVRGRFTNLFVTGILEHKKLADDVAFFIPAVRSQKRVVIGRVGVLGNHSDLTLGGGSTSFSATASAGRLRLDATSSDSDAGVNGAHTAGGFSKVNIELQRVQYLSLRSSVLLNVTGQLASKNLTSAEKLNLGGPNGVRGYPIGEGVGDEGVLASLEYRYQTNFKLAGEALSVTAFYDVGSIRRDRVRNDTTLKGSLGNANSLTLDSVGLGVLLGREGNYLLTGALATRVGGPLPKTGDPDSRARLWFLLQKWF